MKEIRLIILSAFFCSCINGHCYSQTVSECNPFKNRTFINQNGIDTITLKVLYEDINPMAANYGEMLKTEKNINPKDFKYQIVFKPIGCENTFFCPSSAKSTFVNDPKNIGKTVNLTLVVFKNYKYDFDGTPYFVAIKVKL